MDTYGRLFEGSDRDSADRMEQLFGNGSRSAVVLAIANRKAGAFWTELRARWDCDTTRCIAISPVFPITT